MSSPFPQLQYLVAFNNGPLDDPQAITTVAAPGTLGADNVWSDITQWVTQHQITRGKQHELDEFEAGTLTLSMDNTAGQFNPWNSAGPFFGHLAPMRLVQVRVTIGDAVFYRFTGHITAIPIVWPDPRSAQAQITASDAFRLFNTNTLSTAGLVEQLAGARIDALLDLLGWSSTARAIQTGTTMIQADTQNQVDTAALAVLQSVEETEGGGLYINGQGVVTFLQRGALAYNPDDPASPYAATQLTIGDQNRADEVPFQPAPTLALDDLDLYNQSVVTRVGGTVQTYDDTESQATYGLHTWKPTGDMLFTNDEDALNRGVYVVSNYAQPRVRFGTIAVQVTDLDTAQLAALLALDLMYRVTINRHAVPGGGTPFVQIGNVEGITERVNANSWLVTLAIAPTAPTDLAGYWVWDSSKWATEPNTTRWN